MLIILAFDIIPLSCHFTGYSVKRFDCVFCGRNAAACLQTAMSPKGQEVSDQFNLRDFWSGHQERETPFLALCFFHVSLCFNHSLVLHALSCAIHSIPVFEIFFFSVISTAPWSAMTLPVEKHTAFALGLFPTSPSQPT